MFFQPGSLRALRRGEWSLARVAMWPPSEPAQRASRSPPSAGRSGGPILAKWAPRLHLLLGEEEVLRAGLGPDALPLGLRVLDPLEAARGREVHDVDRTARHRADADGAIDRLLLRPRRAGGGEVGGLDAPGGDGLVLEVIEDVAVLAMQLADPAQRREPLHHLSDEVVRAHALWPLLVRHEDLVGRHPHLEGLGQALEDVGLVVEDEVEAEVEHRGLARLVREPLGGLGEGLAVVVFREGDQGGEPGMRRRQGPRAPVVVHRAQVDVAVDEPGQDELARGVDGALGGGESLVMAQRHDAAASDGHRGVQHLGGGDDAAAADDGVDRPAPPSHVLPAWAG